MTLFDSQPEPIRFVVLGEPIPRGSKTAVPLRRRDGSYVMKNGRIVTRVIDDNPRSGKWMATVQKAARATYRGEPITGPVEMKLVFYFARRKFHFGTGRNAGTLKESAPKLPAVKPDVSKLARAIEDALSKVVYVDDAQIVSEQLEKQYGEPERVVVEVTPVT